MAQLNKGNANHIAVEMFVQNEKISISLIDYPPKIFENSGITKISKVKFKQNVQKTKNQNKKKTKQKKKKNQTPNKKLIYTKKKKNLLVDTQLFSILLTVINSLNQFYWFVFLCWWKFMIAIKKFTEDIVKKQNQLLRTEWVFYPMWRIKWK